MRVPGALSGKLFLFIGRLMSEILFNILTKIGEISGVAAMIMTYIFYRQISAEKSARTKEIREWEELKSKLTNLEEEKFSDLSNKVENHIKEVDTHIKEDRSLEILNELKHLNGGLTRLADKFDLVNRHDAEQKATLEAHDLYLKNLNETLQAHIRSRH